MRHMLITKFRSKCRLHLYSEGKQEIEPPVEAKSTDQFLGLVIGYVWKWLGHM